MPSDGNLIAERLKDVAAMALVGDGVLALLMPQIRTRLWFRGPTWWERIVGPLTRRPNLVRLLAVAEAGVGVWLACREPVEPAV
jgi:hypothetical protein